MKIKNDLGYEIRTLSNLLKRKMFESALPPEGEELTDMQGQIVDYLFENQAKEIFQRDIEENFFIRRSTVSRFLKTLELKEIVSRETVSQDARLKKVELTPKAIAFHEELKKKIEKIEALATKGLTEEEICQFILISEKIKKNLG